MNSIVVGNYRFFIDAIMLPFSSGCSAALFMNFFTNLPDHSDVLPKNVYFVQSGAIISSALAKVLLEVLIVL